MEQEIFWCWLASEPSKLEKYLAIHLDKHKDDKELFFIRAFPWSYNEVPSKTLINKDLPTKLESFKDRFLYFYDFNEKEDVSLPAPSLRSTNTGAIAEIFIK